MLFFTFSFSSSQYAYQRARHIIPYKLCYYAFILLCITFLLTHNFDGQKIVVYCSTAVFIRGIYFAVCVCFCTLLLFSMLVFCIIFGCFSIFMLCSWVRLFSTMLTFIYRCCRENSISIPKSSAKLSDSNHQTYNSRLIKCVCYLCYVCMSMCMWAHMKIDRKNEMIKKPTKAI